MFFKVFLSNSLVIWMGAILFASLYSEQNEGGSGWYLPFNIMIWAIVCVFILVTFVKVLYCQYMVASRPVFYFSIMLCAIFLAGSVFADTQSDLWLQTLFGFLVVGLFLWALFQYPLTHRHFFRILVLLCVVGFIQSFIAIIQSHDVYRVAYTMIPYEAFRFGGDRPLGNFQQVNMLASFLSLVLVVTLYLMLSSFFLRSSRVFKLWLFLVVLSSFYALLLTGSRAGLLAFIVGVICMLVARQRFLRQHVILFLVWLLALSLAFIVSVYFPGQALGLSFVLEKIGGLSGEARASLYVYALDMFIALPFFGLGIGNFIEPFAEYIRTQNNTALMALRFTHPHNEWLFWMLQSGKVALFLPIMFAVYYLFCLHKIRYGYVYMVLALLLPLFIQAQLSYPFTLSSLHLFTLIFFIYVGVRFVKKSYGFSINKWFQRGVIAIVLFLASSVLYGAWHTLKSIKEVYIFENSLFYTQFQTKEEIASQRYLEYATHNVLYRKDVVKAMNAMVNKAIKSNNRYDLNQFVWWAEKRGGEISQQSLENLAKVYLAQGKLSQVDKVVEELLSTYGVVLTRAELQQDLALIKAKKRETDLK